MRTFLSSFSPRPLLSFVLLLLLPSVRASISSIVQSIPPVYIRFRDGRGNSAVIHRGNRGNRGTISRDLLIFDYDSSRRHATGEQGRSKRWLKLIDAEREDNWSGLTWIGWIGWRIKFGRVGVLLGGKTGKDWLVNVARRAAALFSQDGRIEFANLQIGFQLAYYRVRLFRLKAGGQGN